MHKRTVASSMFDPDIIPNSLASSPVLRCHTHVPCNQKNTHILVHQKGSMTHIISVQTPFKAAASDTPQIGTGEAHTHARSQSIVHRSHRTAPGESFFGFWRAKKHKTKKPYLETTKSAHPSRAFVARDNRLRYRLGCGRIRCH